LIDDFRRISCILLMSCLVIILVKVNTIGMFTSAEGRLNVTECAYSEVECYNGFSVAIANAS